MSSWKSVLHEKYVCRFEPTKYKGHGIELAKVSQEELILSLGGDGLIHEVVNGIILNNNQPTLVFHSCGTGNDYNKVLPGCSSPKHLIQMLESNQIVHPDILKVEDLNQTAYCVNAMDIGFGGKVVDVLEENRSKNKRHPYTRAILKTFKNYKPSELSLQIEGENKKYTPLLIAVSKGIYFGSGIGICPQANLYNQKMAVTIIDRVSMMTYIKYLPKLKKAVKIQDPRISYLLRDKLRIDLKDHSMEIDGELYKFSNTINISVVSHAISVLTS